MEWHTPLSSPLKKSSPNLSLGLLMQVRGIPETRFLRGLTMQQRGKAGWTPDSGRWSCTAIVTFSCLSLLRGGFPFCLKFSLNGIDVKLWFCCRVYSNLNMNVQGPGTRHSAIQLESPGGRRVVLQSQWGNGCNKSFFPPASSQITNRDFLIMKARP